MGVNPRSLGFRLIAWYEGLFLVICAGFAVGTYFWLHSYLYMDLANLLSRRCRQLSALWDLDSHAMTEGAFFSEIKAAYAPERNDRFIRVSKVGGSVLYVSGKPVESSFDPAQLPAISLPAGKNDEITLLKSPHMMVAVRTIRINGSDYLIEFGTSLGPIDHILDAYLGILAAGVGLELLIAVGGGVFLVRMSLRPVRRIIHAAQDITYQNLQRRLPVSKSGDELENLSVVLNEMIARLEAAFRSTQRFAGLASHELRTPLTIMIGELEAVVRTCNLESDARERIQSVLEETEHLTKIVAGLSTITHLEAGEARLDSSEFDLSELTAATCEQMAPLGEDKGVSIRCESKGALEIIGDRPRMKQVVVNLLDNAIKYSPAGKEVVVSAAREDGDAVLKVEDSGSGISEESLPHIFEAFYRSDDPRTRQIHGVGLGLSIVQSICLSHRGLVRAENRPEGGCAITVRIPLKAQNPL